MKVKKIKRIILISLALIIILTATFFLITSTISKYTGYSVSASENDFENCLKEHAITLFINSENPSETLKGISLYDYLDLFKVVNCKRNNNPCIENGVSGPFPTWLINNNLIKRDISVKELSESSGCKI